MCITKLLLTLLKKIPQNKTNMGRITILALATLLLTTLAFESGMK
jgi:hypothetical protein